MGKKLYVKSETGIRFKSNRKPGEVRIPNYVYDLWVPILGAEAIGVYAVYCRLEREGTVKGMSMSDLAKACRIGKSKLQRINNDLARCGFIKITPPSGQAKLMHWTNEIEILDPPREVGQVLAAELLPNREHELLAPWLMEEDELEPPMVPSGTAVDPSQNRDAVPDSTPNIESLGLQPSFIAGGAAEKTPPAPSRDFLTDAFNGHVNGLDPGVADPSQDIEQYMQYANDFLEMYRKRTGLHADSNVQKPAIQEIATQPGADLALWDQVITAWVKHGWNKRNVAGMIECYERGEVPSTNGGKPNATHRRGNHSKSGISGNRQRPEYKVADPSKFSAPGDT